MSLYQAALTRTGATPTPSTPGPRPSSPGSSSRAPAHSDGPSSPSPSPSPAPSDLTPVPRTWPAPTRDLLALGVHVDSLVLRPPAGRPLGPALTPAAFPALTTDPAAGLDSLARLPLLLLLPPALPPDILAVRPWSWSSCSPPAQPRPRRATACRGTGSHLPCAPGGRMAMAMGSFCIGGWLWRWSAWAAGGGETGPSQLPPRVPSPVARQRRLGPSASLLPDRITTALDTSGPSSPSPSSSPGPLPLPRRLSVLRLAGGRASRGPGGARTALRLRPADGTSGSAAVESGALR